MRDTASFTNESRKKKIISDLPSRSSMGFGPYQEGQQASRNISPPVRDTQITLKNQSSKQVQTSNSDIGHVFKKENFEFQNQTTLFENGGRSGIRTTKKQSAFNTATQSSRAKLSQAIEQFERSNSSCGQIVVPPLVTGNKSLKRSAHSQSLSRSSMARQNEAPLNTQMESIEEPAETNAANTMSIYTKPKTGKKKKSKVSRVKRNNLDTFQSSDKENNKRFQSTENAGQKLMRKHVELERDFLKLKNKYIRQQNNLNRVQRNLHEMTRVHEADQNLIYKSENVIKRI